MSLVPLGNRILVEDIFEKYEGMLEIPPTSKEKPTFRGKVVAISDSINNPKVAGSTMIALSIGDTIVRGEFIGQIIDQKKDTLGRLVYQTRLMNVQDVLGKV